MTNFWDLKETSLTKAILITSNYIENQTGVIQAYIFNKLKLDTTPVKKEGNRVYYNIEGGKYWTGGYEPKNFTRKETQPFNRMFQMYMPHSFDQLDIIQLQDAGRFFSLKKTQNIQGIDDSIDYKTDRLAIIYPLNEIKEFTQELGKIIQLTGVPEQHIDYVRNEVITKLNI